MGTEEFVETFQEPTEPVPETAQLTEAEIAAVIAHQALAGILPSPGGTFADLQIVDIIGTGSYGWVYEAVRRYEAIQREEPCALKILRPDFIHDPAMVDRQWREAGILLQIRHPNLVRCISHGEYWEIPFIELELLRGETLSGRIRSTDPAIHLERRQALRAILDISDAVGELHAHGVVHRDIKPGNIFVTTEGRAVLFDLGLAWAPFECGAPVTPDGELVGSVDYIAPEQATRAHASVKMDIFSLGATVRRIVYG